MIYFTADEHYGHENIIEYCKRPFDSVENMNEELVRRHNEVVGKADYVYHLGDTSLANKKLVLPLIKRLQGTHMFLRGSHDAWLVGPNVPTIIEKKLDGKYVVMCHYAMRVWPRSHYGSYQLYGHSHGTLPPLKNQLDVGVDCWNYYPVSWVEVAAALA